MSLGAQILNGLVTNIVLYDGSMVFPGVDQTVDITNVTPKPGIGWGYSGGVFTDRSAQIAAARTAALYQTAKDLLVDDAPISKKEKAVLLVILDEFNTHTTCLTAMFAAVAAATTLADLKTRYAAITQVPQRTIAQLKTAVASKIDAGAADG